MTDQPLRIGVALFPGFQALDVFGPLDCLNALSKLHPLTLTLLSSTLDPISTAHPAYPTAISQSILPTSTYKTAPPLDVLFVPGGQGARDSTPEILEVLDFIATVYPSLKYLITVCTGSGLAARAGVLDGKRATTNKRAWKDTTAVRDAVIWVPRARWVVDGRIWTSSGVSAGIDVTLAWMKEVLGEEVANEISERLEYTRQTDSSVDAFAELYGLV
ncbi:class I glutamine amidotransferase-like protein [Penicillium malachiteum]|uniref:Class I glutamine amidotransferase-like protein n=1 Tax=Penicillium malachiteum TaxID=1324776 RepID=A0AAD6HG33_9EURO|nr:class I glutamine amidotransferase-like protein [Penicillium malachiteum]